MNETIVVGLTGQTGAGKSTVSKIFEAVGFLLIDADQIARLVVEPGKPCLADLFDYFGDVIRNSDDTLNRKKLASIVFTDRKKLESLNSITHPFITEEIFRQINAADSGLILLDAPTLFESKASDFCDLIISVLAPREIRFQRIMKRDGITPKEAYERINSQLSEDFFLQHSDYVIHNCFGLEKLSAHAEEVAVKIKESYQAKLI